MRQFNRVLTGTVCGSLACSIISSNIVSGIDVSKISWFKDKEEIDRKVEHVLSEMNEGANQKIKLDLLKKVLAYAFKAMLSRKGEDLYDTEELKELTELLNKKTGSTHYAGPISFATQFIMPIVNDILGVIPGKDKPLKDKPDLSNEDADKIIDDYLKKYKESLLSKVWRYLPLTDFAKPELLELKKELGEYYYHSNIHKIYPEFWQRQAIINKETMRGTFDEAELKKNELDRKVSLALYFADGDKQLVKEINDIVKKIQMEDMLVNHGSFGINKVITTLFSPNTAKNIGYAFLTIFGNRFLPIFKTIGKAANETKNFVKNLFRSSINAKNYKSMLNGLKKRLQVKIIGQRKAIDQVISRLEQYYSSAVKAKKLGKPFKKGCRIILRGNPGLGKTVMISEIADFLNVSSAVIGMKDIVDDRGLKTDTVVDRLMKPVIKETWFGKKVEDTDLTQLLKTNPTGRLFVFDETDKMNAWERQKQGINTTEILKNGGKLSGTSLQELLRVYVDEGKIGKFDTENCIVFQVTNETREDINNNESSIASRELNDVIDFEDFDEQDCKAFCLKAMKDLVGEYYEKKEGIRIVWDEKDLELYSKYLAKKGTSGRTLSVISQKWTPAVDHVYEKDNGVKEITLHWDKDKGDDGVFAVGK